MENTADNEIFGKLRRILFGFIGAGIIFVAGIWGIFTWAFVNGAATANGTVIALNAGGSHPEIKFTAENGQEINYPQGGLIAGYQVGDQVSILYDPENPRRCELNTFGALWGFNITTALMGVVFICAALFLKS